MSKQFWIVLILVIAGLFGILKFTGGSKASTKTDKYANGNILEVKAADHKAGAGNKKVTVIEYGDFQCPSCGNFFPLMEQARTEYKDDITFVFRHFPITSKHQNAQAAARASEAAANQNKFFEMYEQLYKTQTSWETSKDAQSIFEGYAQTLGLDLAKFKTDYASEEINNRIATDLKSAQDAGVTGTPGIFINGKQIDNPSSYTAFKKDIDDAIASSNPAPAPQTEPSPAPAQ